MKDTIDIVNGSTISLASFKVIQADLVEQGYELTIDHWPDQRFVCPECEGRTGVIVTYELPGKGHSEIRCRDFNICLECWHVTKLIHVFDASGRS